jgi:membrane dipeptidase
VENERKVNELCGDNLECQWRKSSEITEQLVSEGKLPHVSWERIVDHIDHVAKLAGPDHVGLGSDFDGADMPDGMENCSKLPKITEGLMRKGYSDADILKILGGNTLRVIEQAERVSKEMLARP